MDAVREERAGRFAGGGFGRLEIPQIDTLRVLAMLGVFLHHLWNSIILTPSGLVQSVLDLTFDTASDGVIFFNFISGFLLARPYLGPERRPFVGWKGFIEKRFLRIIPPYYISLFLFSLGNVLIFAVPLRSALTTLLLHVFFLNSLSYPMMGTNFSHFWYLGMLAHFYLLFPLILRLFMRVGPGRAALWIIACCWGGWGALALYLSAFPDSSLGMAGYMIHFNLPGRLPEFAIGMWLASCWNPSPDSSPVQAFGRPFRFFFICMAAVTLVTLPLVSKENLPLSHIGHVGLSLVFFIVLLAWNPAAQWGRFGWMRNLSAHSYAMYIVHEPLMSYIGIMPGRIPATLGYFAFYLGLLFSLTYAAARALDGLASKALPGASARKPSPSLPPPSAASPPRPAPPRP